MNLDCCTWFPQISQSCCILNIWPVPVIPILSQRTAHTTAYSPLEGLMAPTLLGTCTQYLQHPQEQQKRTSPFIYVARPHIICSPIQPCPLPNPVSPLHSCPFLTISSPFPHTSPLAPHTTSHTTTQFPCFHVCPRYSPQCPIRLPSCTPYLPPIKQAHVIHTPDKQATLLHLLRNSLQIHYKSALDPLPFVRAATHLHRFPQQPQLIPIYLSCNLESNKAKPQHITCILIRPIPCLLRSRCGAIIPTTRVSSAPCRRVSEREHEQRPGERARNFYDDSGQLHGAWWQARYAMLISACTGSSDPLEINAHAHLASL